MKNKIKNYSDKYEWEILKMLPHNLEAEEIVILPDVNYGKAPLPTGCVVKTKQENWRNFAVSDVGCGMQLIKSNINININQKEFQNIWNHILYDIKKNKGKLGDLGSGNHFLDAIHSYNNNMMYFLIHTGSRDESYKVEKHINNYKEFDKIYYETIEWAKQNRITISKIIEKHFGKIETIIHNNHNHFELLDNGEVIIRKGAVRLYPNEISVIPSHMTGEIVLVKGKDNLSNSLHSISHGTGRVMSRSDAKEVSRNYDFTNIRNTIYIPESISNESIKTDAPFCYRSIDEVMILLDDLVEEIERFYPVAYIGHI